MNMPRIAVIDPVGSVIGHLDNNAPDGARYYDDRLRTFLKGSASTFEFVSPNTEETYKLLKQGNKLSFTDGGRAYYMSIVRTEETEFDIEVEARGGMLELINTEVEPYEAKEAQNFAEYLAIFDKEHVLTLKKNEIASSRKKLKFDGTDSLLERLYSLAGGFDAELEFLPVLSRYGTLEAYTVNVFKEYDGDSSQGLGRATGKALRYGYDFEWMKRTVDMTDFCTALRPIGDDGLTIKTLEREERDENGKLLYYTREGSAYMYAPKAKNSYPSNELGGNDYIIRPYSVNTKSKDTLWSSSLKELKRRSKPKVSYSMRGFVDANIGDSFHVQDDRFSTVRLMKCRVVEQSRSFTDPSRNETEFSNFKTVKSGISSQITAKMQELANGPQVFYSTCDTPKEFLQKEVNIEQDSLQDGSIVVVSFEEEHQQEASAQISLADETYSIVTADGLPANWYDNTTLVLSVDGDKLVVTNEEATNYNGDGNLQSAPSEAGAEGCITTIRMKPDAFMPAIEVNRNDHTQRSAMTDNGFSTYWFDENGNFSNDKEASYCAENAYFNGKGLLAEDAPVTSVNSPAGAVRKYPALGYCVANLRFSATASGKVKLGQIAQDVAPARVTALACYYNTGVTASAYINASGEIYVDVTGSTSATNIYISGMWFI